MCRAPVGLTETSNRTALPGTERATSRVFAGSIEAGSILALSREQRREVWCVRRVKEQAQQVKRPRRRTEQRAQGRPRQDRQGVVIADAEELLLEKAKLILQKDYNAERRLFD